MKKKGSMGLYYPEHQTLVLHTLTILRLQFILHLLMARKQEDGSKGLHGNFCLTPEPLPHVSKQPFCFLNMWLKKMNHSYTTIQLCLSQRNKWSIIQSTRYFSELNNRYDYIFLFLYTVFTLINKAIGLSFLFLIFLTYLSTQTRPWSPDQRSYFAKKCHIKFHTHLGVETI